jgi:UMF1 family MFS transporter
MLAGTLAYGSSNVLYNAFLPRIAPPGRREEISSRGFAFGYLGGGLLLALNLGLLLAHHALGISKATAVRICFVSAGVWWAAFGLWALQRFPRRSSRVALIDHGGARKELVAALGALRGAPHTRRYLIAYLLFSDAISAVLALSSTFITHQLFGDSASRAATFLFALILLIQFVAMAGAVLFARLSLRWGTKRTIMLSLVVWCAVIVYAYVALQSKAQAVLVGVIIGLVLGGSQALARALWARLVPVGREATFFGVYEVANEGTAWIAPLLFTIVVNVTGSFRQAILSLLVLFVAGLVMLGLTDVKCAEREFGGSAH